MPQSEFAHGVSVSAIDVLQQNLIPAYFAKRFLSGQTTHGFLRFQLYCDVQSAAKSASELLMADHHLISSSTASAGSDNQNFCQDIVHPKIPYRQFYLFHRLSSIVFQNSIESVIFSSLVSKDYVFELYVSSQSVCMDFLPTNELPLRPKKVEVYLTLRAFLTTTIRYFCALAPLTVGFLYISLPWLTGGVFV